MLLLAGCSGDEGQAGTLYVDEVTLADDIATPGPSGIDVVRVVDGAEALGAYPLPARVPVTTARGARDIRFEAVVRRAGVAERLTVYPMYAAAEVPAPTQAGRVDTVRPQFALAEGTEELLADEITFGFSAFTSDLDADTATSFAFVAPSGDLPFARGEVSAESPVLEAASRSLAVPGGWDEVWLELDYRGSALLRVALVRAEPEEAIVRATRYLQGVFARDGFNRFYFDLGDPVEDPAGAELLGTGVVRVALLVIYDPDGPPVQRADIDNVRLLAR